MTEQTNTAAEDQHPAAPDPAGATALVAAAQAIPPDTADPTVSLAFALGWQMAELFRPQLRHRAERRDDDLPVPPQPGLRSDMS
jgi:L-alanine-DL-glutamate epimerase-like enolase superfamily enzyme